MSRRWSEALGGSRNSSGRRGRVRTLEGHAVLAQRAAPAWPATLAAARGRPLALAHLRAVQRSTALPARTVFLLDCSASMVASGALAYAKGLLMPWLRHLRRQNAEVVVVGFGGSGAEWRFGPAVPRGWSARWLAPIPGGGGTPLGSGVHAAQDYGRRGSRGKRAAPTRHVSLVLLTDGRSDELALRPDGFDVIDIVLPLGDGGDRVQDALWRGLGQRQAERLALRWGARCYVR